MKYVSAVFSLVVTLAVTYFSSVKLGPLPPIGAFFNPISGFWANAVLDESLPDGELAIAGLTSPVTVLYEKRGVPHIFATNDYDLYFAQGYVTARDRLWQMEFGARASAGRLSEVLGARTIAYDSYQRNIGMPWAAERMVEVVSKDSVSLAVMQAYADGVNAYIRSLRARDLPIEFKLLDYKPEPWTVLKSALLAKNMQYTLTGYSNEYLLANTRRLLSAEDFDSLFPLYAPYQDPIIPDTTKFAFTPDTIPLPPEQLFIPGMNTPGLGFQPDKANGSNNWVVSGKKTLSGFPILSDDMHLSNTLPAIWYETQLNTPGLNVYGVTIPGIPTVIVGFNERIAWGFTNVGADFMDWYAITFRDSTRAEYLFDGKWLPTTAREERIKVRGSADVVQQLVFTHHGPVAYSGGGTPMKKHIPAGYALRWTAHDPTNVLQAFLNLNKASNYDEYVTAVSYLATPGQNVAYADRDGNIAIYVTGEHPIRWKGQGRFPSDGSSSKYDWHGFIPHAQKPNIKNPARGWVSSANQFPVDPNKYPYYIGWDFANYERGARINQRLAELSEITANDMRLLQMDAKSLHAMRVLPVMLDQITIDSLSGSEVDAYLALKAWDFVNRGEEMAPSIFNRWWDVLHEMTWEDDFPYSEPSTLRPSRAVTVNMVLEAPGAKWFDDKRTPDIENVAVLARRSFRKAVADLEKAHGRPGPNWRWSLVKRVPIGHIAMLPGFGKDHVETSGGGENVNATRDQHGPSWRMIVDLAPDGQAYGIYPGGQTGNPGSRNYENDIREWASGYLHTLHLLKSPADKPEVVRSRQTLKGN